MTLGYDKPLYILAADHRGSFQKKFFGITGRPSSEEASKISDAKQVIFEGLLKALDDGAPREASGFLVDEQFGGDIARKARAEGLTFAMPCEKSGQDEFDFEFGDEFGEHIEDFDPTFSKVLVRYNPEGDREMNARQAERLKRLGEWLHANGRRYLFELLVPAEPHQLESVGGDADRYDREVRPALMRATIRELHAAGIEPDIWKIEGIDRREDCEEISATVRDGDRDGVACVVLGRGANREAVDHWLRMGSGVPGYIGFAIGRTIWWDPLMAYVKGELPRGEVTSRVSANYRSHIDVYTAG
ncbi:MAG TPA: DUF2090 domain-containing protein [Actinomycetota bacterium]|nr:DUF2090 domain-containing protein [Actinomycetota bacterium]